MAIVHPDFSRVKTVPSGYGDQSGSYITPDGQLLDVGLPEEPGDE